MSKAKLALMEFWKRLCGIFRLTEHQHYYIEHDPSRIRDEHYERIYRYGALGLR